MTATPLPTDTDTETERETTIGFSITDDAIYLTNTAADRKASTATRFPVPADKTPASAINRALRDWSGPKIGLIAVAHPSNGLLSSIMSPNGAPKVRVSPTMAMLHGLRETPRAGQVLQAGNRARKTTALMKIGQSDVTWAMDEDYPLYYTPRMLAALDPKFADFYGYLRRVHLLERVNGLDMLGYRGWFLATKYLMSLQGEKSAKNPLTQQFLNKAEGVRHDRDRNARNVRRELAAHLHRRTKIGDEDAMAVICFMTELFARAVGDVAERTQADVLHVQSNVHTAIPRAIEDLMRDKFGDVPAFINAGRPTIRGTRIVMAPPSPWIFEAAGATIIGPKALLVAA